ncbi:MAG: hypothetical protein M3Q48_01385 [Actinomycetota bacterium]|nr:hypothetical protein [Actinomycetota bacterium]
MIRLVLAVVMFLVIMRVGLAVLRALARPLPGPPPPGEMRRVNVRYRCPTCGVELRITIAPEADPDPPRHCMEEMQLVAPVE